MAHTCRSSIWECQDHQDFKASLSYIARVQPWLHETLFPPPTPKKSKQKKREKKIPNIYVANSYVLGAGETAK